MQYYYDIDINFDGFEIYAEFAAYLIDLDGGGIVMDQIDFAFKKILLAILNRSCYLN
jgi:hypothetical protein